jgi:hypothetical protein
MGHPTRDASPPSARPVPFSTTLRAPTVESESTMLTTLLRVFKRDTKRALSGGAECPAGRNGTLRTAREGRSPAESGTAVPTSGARSDMETGTPVITKRGAGSPERGRAGEFTSLHTRSSPIQCTTRSRIFSLQAYSVIKWILSFGLGSILGLCCLRLPPVQPQS